MGRIRWRWILAVAASAGIVTTMAGAHGGSPALIHACVNKVSKIVRIVAPSAKCKKTERAIDWPAQTAVGAQGVQGPQGTPGQPGQDGEDGQDGQQGIQGEPGIVWRGSWAADTRYNAGDAVEHEGSSFVALETTDEAPSEGSHSWGLLAAKGDAGPPGSTDPPFEPYSESWFLDIDGSSAAAVHSVEGCAPFGEVVVEALGPDAIARKHLANVRYADCVIEVGLGMTNSLKDWIESAFDQAYVTRNIVLYRAGGPRISATSVLIRSVELPALDASDSAPAYLRLRLAPEDLSVNASDPGPPPTLPLKPIIQSTLAFSLSGISNLQPTRLNPWKFEVDIAADAVGGGRDETVDPVTKSLGDLLLRDPETDTAGIAALRAWFQSFVIQGSNDETHEKTATLTVGDGAGSTLTLNFSGVGIFQADPAPRIDGTRKFSLYVEDADFDLTSPAG